MQQQKSSWNSEYYEILEFYYWEPQHLGKSKNPKNKYNSLEKVLEHIGGMEVSLNHQFNMFFSLIPSKETNELFSSVFEREFKEEFSFNSQATRCLVDTFKSTTQPDLFFPSDNELVCIEMKVSAQSDFDQFAKYLLLSLLENERSGVQKEFSLLYTGVHDFSKLFKEGIESIEELRSEFLKYEIGAKTKNGAIDLNPYRNDIYRLSQEINIAYLSYKNLYNLLLEKQKLTKNEALQNIYEGLLMEIRSRNFL